MLPTKPTMPGWIRAYEAVWSLLPSTREHITPARSCITPGALIDRAELAGLSLELIRIPRWEEHDTSSRDNVYTKMELFDRIFDGIEIPVGEVIFIVDSCFPITDNEPFYWAGESLRSLISEFSLFVFDSDVVFIWPEARLISVLHHEGVFAHIRCS